MSIELSAEKQAFASAQLDEAGLGEFVEWRVRDAREELAKLDGPLHVVLIALRKDLYVDCFEIAYPKLAPKGLIIAENMIIPDDAKPEAIA